MRADQGQRPPLPARPPGGDPAVPVVRTWTDVDGAWNPDYAAPRGRRRDRGFLAPFTHARQEAARTPGHANPARPTGPTPSWTSPGPRPAGRDRRGPGADTKVFVHMTPTPPRRGSTVPGSICHIDGPRPHRPRHRPSPPRRGLRRRPPRDTTGDIRSVIHLGRQVTAHQRSALSPGLPPRSPWLRRHLGPRDRTPPALRRHRRHHPRRARVACGRHHHEKTHLGATLTGPPGNRTWTAPDGHLRDRPPSRRAPQRPRHLRPLDPGRTHRRARGPNGGPTSGGGRRGR